MELLVSMPEALQVRRFGLVAPGIVFAVLVAAQTLVSMQSGPGTSSKRKTEGCSRIIAGGNMDVDTPGGSCATHQFTCSRR